MLPQMNSTLYKALVLIIFSVFNSHFSLVSVGRSLQQTEAQRSSEGLISTDMLMFQMEHGQMGV